MSERAGHAGTGCSIPPEVYDMGLGWDPGPEVDRMLFLARQAGVEARSALELGCGTGRLLARLRDSVPDLAGVELCPAMAERARQRGGASIHVGDMSDFALGRRFDLIFTSANTIRHVLDDSAIRRMWHCIAEHLTPGGAFIADLELGVEAEAARAGRAVRWTLACGEAEVRVSWTVRRPPRRARPITTIEWEFLVLRSGSQEGWCDAFDLRAYDGDEFVRLAEAAGGLALAGVYEPRDPYLHAIEAERAAGRSLVVLRARG